MPAKAVAEFIAYAKADSTNINMGSGGKGATGHVAGELFQMMAGVKFQHIPYRGEAPAMTDLIGGQVQLVFATTGSSLQYIKAGQMRALAVTTHTRAVDLPDMPPLADTLPGYEASSWSGFVTPRNTPADIIDKLNKELNTAAANSAVQARFARARCTAIRRLARRLRQDHCRRRRKMGQGDQSFGSDRRLTPEGVNSRPPS